MNLDPFSKNEPIFPGIPGSSSPPGKSKSSADEVFVKSKNGGAGRRTPPPEPLEPMDMAPAEAIPEPEKKEKVVLRNPKWEAAEVGFNEETDISVELQLPPEHANKKKVLFELFAKTPKDPERISQAEGFEDAGKATAKIPLYQPNYKDADGNLLSKVDYYFTAKHSQSDLLKDAKAVRTVDHKAGRVIESHVLEDTTFDTDSSFLHPRNAAALAALRDRVKAWREKYPDGTLAVFGHTDAVGQEGYNKGLSERRARSVHAFLIKDVSVWENLYGGEKWGLKQVQTLLKHLGQDPGAIDGLDGPRTQAAFKGFQEKAGLPVQTQNTAGTRKDLFQAFADGLNDLKLDKKAFENINGNPFTGCSEFNLLEDAQGALEKNRRVTVLLLKSSKNFPVNYPCAMGDVQKCQAQVKKNPGKRRRPSFKCFFYDDLVIEEGGGGSAGMPEFPDYDPGAVAKPEDCGCANDDGPVPADAPAGALKLLGAEDGAEVKQYVNLKADKAGQGPERLIEVEAEGAADGTTVFWKVTAAKENSRRNLPKTGIKPDSKGALTEFKEGVAEIETAVAGGKASFVLACGLAGGDGFTVEGGLEKGKAGATLMVVAWRKAWYQITREKGLALPALTNFIKAYELAFVSLERTRDEEFEKKDAPARTFYPQWMVSPGGADAEVAVIGSHNKAHYRKLEKAVEGEDPKAHLVICRHQFDEGGESEVITETMSGNLSSVIDADIPIFNPPLNGNIIVTGTWKSLAPKGHADHGRTGKITDADVHLEKDRGSLTEFKVKLPADAPSPIGGHALRLVLKLRGVDGPYLGESDGKQILAVLDPSDPIDFQNTLTHEMGHAFNQTPDPNGQSPGLPDHPHHYREHGGIGPHCSTVITGGKEAKGVEKKAPKPDGTGTEEIYETGVCVMFHSGPQPGCLNRYCETCLPYVKATDFSGFGKA